MWHLVSKKCILLMSVLWELTLTHSITSKTIMEIFSSRGVLLSVDLCFSYSSCLLSLLQKLEIYTVVWWQVKPSHVGSSYRARMGWQLDNVILKSDESNTKTKKKVGYVVWRLLNVREGEWVLERYEEIMLFCELPFQLSPQLFFLLKLMVTV